MQGETLSLPCCCCYHCCCTDDVPHVFIVAVVAVMLRTHQVLVLLQLILTISTSHLRMAPKGIQNTHRHRRSRGRRIGQESYPSKSAFPDKGVSARHAAIGRASFAVWGLVADGFELACLVLADSASFAVSIDRTCTASSPVVPSRLVHSSCVSLQRHVFESLPLSPPFPRRVCIAEPWIVEPTTYQPVTASTSQHLYLWDRTTFLTSRTWERVSVQSGHRQPTNQRVAFQTTQLFKFKFWYSILIKISELPPAPRLRYSLLVQPHNHGSTNTVSNNAFSTHQEVVVYFKTRAVQVAVYLSQNR